MFLRKLATAVAITSIASGAWAGCAYENGTEIKSLANSYDAWKSVASAMEECGNYTAVLDTDFKDKINEAFAANPSLYQIGGISNGTMVPPINAGSIRPLDALVAKYGSHLNPSQLIKIDGKIMAIAMSVNNQHFMYREDVLSEFRIAVPTTHAEMVAAAAIIAKYEQ